MERDPRYTMKHRVKVGSPGVGASILGGALIAAVGLIIITNGISEKQQKKQQQSTPKSK